MDNTQNTTHFDAMLKQSLENSQMPVPTGVWETIGSSLGSQAIVATKIVSLKLILLKSVAGLIISSAIGFGIYQLLPEKVIVPKTIVSKNGSFSPKETISLDTFFEASNDQPKNFNSISKKPAKDTALRLIQNKTAAVQSTVLGQGLVNLPTNHQEIIKLTAETLPTEKYSEVKNKKPATQENTAQPYNNVVFPEPANVFTPDGDGINDNFYIVVENEKSFNLQIFDEQGKKVFESNDKNKFWDGTNSLTGEICKPGVYIYTYYYELNTGFKKKDRSRLTLY